MVVVILFEVLIFLGGSGNPTGVVRVALNGSRDALGFYCGSNDHLQCSSVPLSGCSDHLRS